MVSWADHSRRRWGAGNDVARGGSRRFWVQVLGRINTHFHPFLTCF